MLLCWGGNYIAAKIVFREIPAGLVIILRTIVAGLLMIRRAEHREPPEREVEVERECVPDPCQRGQPMDLSTDAAHVDPESGCIIRRKLGADLKRVALHPGKHGAENLDGYADDVVLRLLGKQGVTSAVDVGHPYRALGGGADASAVRGSAELLWSPVLLFWRLRQRQSAWSAAGENAGQSTGVDA
jgi:hypothetical protein